MVEAIKTKTQFCMGCFRCVRECPMETANNTYMDESRNRKAMVNTGQCIRCGRCVKSCKHEARYFADDTEEFLDALSPQRPASLIVSPAIASNIPEYKRVFTFLKQRGVNKIYDASFGGEIHTWATLHCMKKGTPLISSICPSAVLYCEIYHPHLIKHLAPVQSPMACTAIYMKEYGGITEPLAAISPCVCAAVEFEGIKLPQYNVTFKNLMHYIELSGVDLPLEETGFDNGETLLGHLYPVPGGLKKILDFFHDTNAHIAGAQGAGMYAMIDRYAQLPADQLPDFLDLLSCNGGCNHGSGAASSPCNFEIGKKLYNLTKQTAKEDIVTLSQAMHERFDKELDLSKFMRNYRRLNVPFPDVTPDKLEEAYQAMGKDGYDKRNIDCGRCGSSSCQSMARKIVLNVNIPANCVSKMTEDAHMEHQMTLYAHELQRATEEAKNELELQLLKMKMVAKATHIGIYDLPIIPEDILNPNNPFYFDEGIRLILGYSSEEDLPNAMRTWLDSLHPEDVEDVLTQAITHIQDTTGTIPFDIKFRLKTKYGEYRHFRAMGTTLRDADGFPLRAVGAINDITEMRNLVLEAERQRTEAEAANFAKSVFLSHISHEIRTPLNAIIGTAEIELQKDNNQPETEEALERIYDSGQLVFNIINDLLDFSKIEAGKMEIVPAPYNIPSLINDVIQLNALLYEAKGLKLILNIDEEMPNSLIGDELRIKQVLNNVLSNAFKYTDHGEVELSVHVKKHNDNCELFITIRDTGQGMSEDQVSRMFEEYARFNMQSNRSIIGTGLGMTITKRLLSLMSGSIKVKSKPGKGTTCVIRLPQQQISGVAVCGPDIMDKLRAKRYKSFSRAKAARTEYEYMPYGKILIVDDVETNLYVARGLTLPYGLYIETATNGFSAVEKIKNGKVFDVIFMDHMMPKMDGVEATKVIRGMGYSHPIVALTANALTGQAEKFLAEGFDGFISKPIDIRELDLVLNRFIRDKQPPEIIEEARRNAEAKKPAFRMIHDIHEHEQLLQAAMYDIGKSLDALDEIMPNIHQPSEAELKLLLTIIHGIKSTLSHISEDKLSAVALGMELAIKDDRLELVAESTRTFVDALREVYQKNKTTPAKGVVASSPEDTALLHEKLDEIQSACRRVKKSVAKAAMDELKQIEWPDDVNALLEEISTHLLHGAFKRIVAAINDYKKTLQSQL